MKVYKGFDKNFKCRDKQYAENETFKHKGKIELCEAGLHACEIPFDVLHFYNDPAGKYVEAEAIGEIKTGDNKIVTNELKIGIEIGFSGIMKAGFKWVKEVCQKSKDANTAGDSAYANTAGYSAHANTAGNYAHANTAGNYAHANTAGKNSIASSFGFNGAASSTKGNWIVLAEWVNGNIKEVKSVLIDGETIKANTPYSLVNGEFVEI